MENSANYTIVAKTHFGLEAVLAEELKQLGAEKIELLTRAVSFEGNDELLYKANLQCRTALRILKPLFSFKARNEHALYKGVLKFDWSTLLSFKDTLAIDSAVNSKFFNHSKYVALKTKDAIVDQFREKSGIRPSVELDDPTVRLNIHISEDDCTISLDSSGSSLHKRGYRMEKNAAPLNEVLAAGMILLSGWDKNSNFIDPMCGSGTIVIEAALYAYNIAPGLIRRKFGFQNWKDYNRELWDRICKEAEEQITPFAHSIVGSDNSSESVGYAKNNIRLAKLEGKVEVIRKDFEEQEPPKGGGVMIMNPPYGERLKEENIDAFYKAIGDRLKKAYAGYDAWLISSNKDALKKLGLHPYKKITLKNGPLECKFQKFPMYDGA